MRSGAAARAIGKGLFMLGARNYRACKLSENNFSLPVLRVARGCPGPARRGGLKTTTPHTVQGVASPVRDVRPPALWHGCTPRIGPGPFIMGPGKGTSMGTDALLE